MRGRRSECRCFCGGRYEYVLPVFAFDPHVGMARDDLEEASAAERGAPPGEIAEGVGATAPSPPPLVFDDAMRARLNRVLSHYVGTKNFHNFTVRPQCPFWSGPSETPSPHTVVSKKPQAVPSPGVTTGLGRQVVPQEVSCVTNKGEAAEQLPSSAWRP